MAVEAAEAVEVILTEGAEKAMSRFNRARRPTDEEFGVGNWLLRQSRQGIEGHMEERLYDLIFICRPDTPEAEVDKVIATLEHTATEKGAKIEKTEKWGRKRMAYRVQAAARRILRVTWCCDRATAKWSRNSSAG